MEISPELADELIHKGYEAPDLDYKLSFDDTTRAWMELAKDVFGMANFGGGYIVIGIEDGTFKPIGVDVTFHIDTQKWVDRISKWATGRIDISYLEFELKINGKNRKFPILFIHGSLGALVIPKTDGIYPDSSGQKCAFKQGVIYTRSSTSTIPVAGEGFWQIFWPLMQRTAAVLGSAGTPLEVISTLSRKALPDNVEETLWFNLFPVIELPDHIYQIDTDFREAKEIYYNIREQLKIEDQAIPPFLIEDKKIYCFSPIDRGNPLTYCATSDSSYFSTKTWLDDDSKHQKLVKLLNFNLKDLCWRRRFTYDPRHERYYIKYNGGPMPEITWRPYKKMSTRQLVRLRTNKNTGRYFYEHFAGKLKFIILGEGIYLLVEPIIVLTVNGEIPLDHERNIKIINKKNLFYHNNNYLYDMKLWLHLLAGTKEEIHLGRGNDKIIVSICSINSKANIGIYDDQHTTEDFLDSLKSEPLEYGGVELTDEDEGNPLTETSLEE